MFDLKKELQAYTSLFPEETRVKYEMLKFLKEQKNPFARETEIGHFTGSAFLLNSNKTKFLLMHHKKLDRWLQPGGHCDGDENVLAVSIKEAREESGIDLIAPIHSSIFDIDIHLVPKNHRDETHYHYDVRFLLHTVNNDHLVKNSESNDLKWVNTNIDDVMEFEVEHSIIRMIHKYNNIKNIM